MNKAIILANGVFPSHAIPLAALHNATRIICCDGALSKLLEAKLHQLVAVVGDGDSLSDTLREQFAPLFVYDGNQETNDLTKSVQYALSQGWSKLTIVGATGQREDHTLGNISLLAEYASYCDIEMLTDYGRFRVVSGSAAIESFPKQQVSIFSITPQVPVTVRGLEYPIENRCLERWWEGTLNAAIGNTFEIMGGKIIVYQTYDPKI